MAGESARHRPPSGPARDGLRTAAHGRSANTCLSAAAGSGPCAGLATATAETHGASEPTVEQRVEVLEQKLMRVRQEEVQPL